MLRLECPVTVVGYHPKRDDSMAESDLHSTTVVVLAPKNGRIQASLAILLVSIKSSADVYKLVVRGRSHTTTILLVSKPAGHLREAQGSDSG